MFGSLGIQVVTYQNDPEQLVRLSQGIAATAHGARAAGVGRIAVRFGECGGSSSVLDVADDLERELAGAVDAVTAVEFGANLGSAGGSNALAEGAADDVLWVLNPDTYPSPRCAAELLGRLAASDVGAVDARQIPIEHPKAYDPVTGDTSWVSGACSMVRRPVFEAIDGFDAVHFPMYGDDVDLSWRLRLAGWRTVHVPAAVVFHDKRIDAAGGVTASEFEVRSGTLAGLLLARRYDRPDVERATLEGIDERGTPAERAAAADFRARERAGGLPEVLYAPHRVARFVDGAYAVHRFGYGS